MQAPFVTRLRSAALSSALLASSWILASPGTVHAQGAPPAPPPGYLFDMSSAGKAWGQMLKSYGIYVNGGFEENIYSVPSGGRKTGTFFQGEYTLGLDLDMNRILGIPGAAIHISTDDRTGPNPSRYYGSGISSTANYGPNDAYRLAELSWDQDLFNDHVRILVGRIADNIDFDTSELYCQFLFSTCGNTNSWYFNHLNSSYPGVEWGGRITLKPTLSTYFRTGAYEENSLGSGGVAPNYGWPWDPNFSFVENKATQGVFVPAEMGYKTNFDNDAYPRGFDVGGYWDTSAFNDPLYNSSGLPLPLGSHILHDGKSLALKDRTGVYVQAQQMVYRVDNTSQRGLTVFGEALFDTSGGGPVQHQVVGGLWDKGPLPFRPADSLGFSVNWWQFNQRFEQALMESYGLQGPANTPNHNEYELELNYGFELAPGVELKPVVAYWIHPDMAFGLSFPGKTHANNAWLVGAQLSLSPNGAFGLPAFVRTN